MHRKDGRGLKFRTFAFKASKVGDDGRFSGYGSVFGVVDSYAEVVAKGAFAESLGEIAATGRTLPALWNHNSNEPIGGYSELAEDDHGLRVDGFLLREEVTRAREVHALMKAGVISGLSIGYYVRESSYDEKTGIRTLKKIDLVEVSPVTFPANDEARIDTIKSKLAHGTFPTIREFEALLREQGFSKSQAARIASAGYKQFDDLGDPGEDSLQGLTDLRKQLSEFSLK